MCGVLLQADLYDHLQPGAAMQQIVTCGCYIYGKGKAVLSHQSSKVVIIMMTSSLEVDKNSCSLDQAV